MKKRHARKMMAHQVDPYRVTLTEYILAGIAAVIAAPLIWAFSVLALTALGSR